MAPGLYAPVAKGKIHRLLQMLGKFLSITDVTMADLGTSIDQVFLSYEEPAGDDEVLIQPMLENVIRSGVAFCTRS